MAIRKLTQAGNPALKASNKKILSFTSVKTKKLIKDLTDTMYKTGLVGIAAPQISENFQVFLTHPRNTKSRKLFKEDIFRVFINPRVVNQSKEQVIIYEGCGSVVKGGIFGPVKRAGEATVEAFDESGKKFSLTTDGLLARVILHEMDHLNGIEFIQKVDDYSKILDETIYKKTIRNSKDQIEAIKITKIDHKRLSA